MQDKTLYQQILGLTEPWSVTRVELDVQKQRVDIYVEHAKAARWVCPVCGKAVGLYDHAEERTWRHLDSCQFQTYLHARIPRVGCPEHGIRNATLPWGERGSRFTMLMECLIINVLQQCQTVTGACRLVGISWDEAMGVIIRSVRRGQARREDRPLTYIGADEKSVKRGYSYVTVVSDLETASVLYVAEGRDTEALAGYYRQLPPQQKQSIKAVALDMCAPYVKATTEQLPEGDQKIVFDRFHIMKMVNEAMDRVRQQEQASSYYARAALSRSRQMWLWGEENLPSKYSDRFAELKRMDLQTAKAWAMKENLRHLWTQPCLTAARDHLVHWLEWVERSRLKPLMHVAKTLREKMPHILNYCLHPITSGVCEGINSKIMCIKRKAAGFRNIDNFKQAILFYCGKLDLYPR
jgi:transposase